MPVLQSLCTKFPDSAQMLNADHNAPAAEAEVPHTNTESTAS